jgi:hypothetical protein
MSQRVKGDDQKGNDWRKTEVELETFPRILEEEGDSASEDTANEGGGTSLEGSSSVRGGGLGTSGSSSRSVRVRSVGNNGNVGSSKLEDDGSTDY